MSKLTGYQAHGLKAADMLPVAGKTVYDVGCGTGWAAIRFAERGAHVTAVDILPADHHKLVELRLAGIPYVCGLSGLLPADYVWCHHTLEHMRDPIAFLEQLRQAGRELWLAVPWAPPHAFAKDHIVRYNMLLLIEHLRRAGFDVANGSFHTSPPHSNLWAVVKPWAGFEPTNSDGCLDGYPEYPPPMAEMNDRQINTMNLDLATYNWPPQKEPRHG